MASRYIPEFGARDLSIVTAYQFYLKKHRAAGERLSPAVKSRLLDRLCGYGIAPGSTITVAQTRPAIILKLGETVLSIDQRIAEGILVEVG